MPYQPLSSLPMHPCQLKNTPLRADMPNTEVNVTPWPLPKHTEVEVQRSQLVSALAPHWAGHVWFGCAPGLFVSMTWYAVKYPAWSPSYTPTTHPLTHTHTSCLPALLPPKLPSSQAMFNLISHIHLFFFLFFLCFAFVFKKWGFFHVGFPLALRRPNLLLPEL